METVKGIVKNVMQSLEVKKKTPPKDDPGALLKKALTKQDLKHVKSGYFRAGVLDIEVDSSAWLYHLNLKKAEILNKLRQKASAVIKDIRFRIG